MLAALAVAGVARGELVQQGDIRLDFNARFSPHALPRDRLAPIDVHLASSVRSASGRTPPPLRRIRVAINRYGRVFTRGLRICTPGLLESTPTKLALSRCRGALIGHGTFLAHLHFVGVRPIPLEGKILAFNGRIDKRPVILLHVYGSDPVRQTFVLIFRVSHPRHGRFGTVISTRIPKIASDLGYVTDVELTLGRRYSYAGRRRSFLSARCAAPPGLPGGLFTFAKADFTFAGHKRVTTTLARDCRVRHR